MSALALSEAVEAGSIVSKNLQMVDLVEMCVEGKNLSSVTFSSLTVSDSDTVAPETSM